MVTGPQALYLSRGTPSRVESPSDDTVCDVVACDKPACGTYLNAASHPGYRFFVCADHLG